MLLPMLKVRIYLVEALQNFHIGIDWKPEPTEKLKNLMMIFKLGTTYDFTELITPERKIS